MYADCPSKGVNNAFLSQADLVGLPNNVFNTLTFTVPAAVRTSVGSSCEDFNLRVTLNVPFNSTGNYLFDNIRGVTITPTTVLPEHEFEVPLIVQARSFNTAGQVFYPQAEDQPAGTLGANPDVNPYWMLLIDGNTNVVNGKVWPNMNVKRHIYRFRMLNSANQRFYDISLSNGMPMQIIGTDGGYKNTVQTVTQFQIGVTERVDFLVDFSNVPVGTQIVMRNTSQLFPPVGPAPDPNTDGTVMRFTVVDSPSVPPKVVPADLGLQVPPLTPDRPRRILIQNVESDDQGRVLQAELDGQLFHELTTELPTIGSTEDWDFVNTTPLDHNKHVHLIQFLVIDRHPFDDAAYLADWKAANGNPPFDHPTLKLAPDALLHRARDGTEPRGERLEGHGVHAGALRDAHPRPLGGPVAGPGDGAGRRQHLPDQPDVRHRLHLALPPGGARGQRDDAADDGHPDLGRRRQLSGRLPRLAGRPARSGRLQQRRLRGAGRPHLGRGPDAKHAARPVGPHQQPERRLGGADPLRRR